LPRDLSENRRTLFRSRSSNRWDLTAMTLKDRLNEALSATPLENTHRRDILNAALNAGDTDEEIGAALNRLIEAREQKAVAFEKTGQAAPAKAERDEADALRLLADPRYTAGPAAPGKPAARGGKTGGFALTKLQMILGGVALVVVAAAVYVAVKPSDEVNLSQQQAGQEITVFKDDHTMGNPNAPVKLLEYAAPMCPMCAHFALEEFPAFKREFIDTGRVFFIFRVYPLGSPDGAVEAIARCLPKARYFPYMEMMFREQAQWDPDGHQIADVPGAIINLAAREGLSEEKAKACMTAQPTLERVNQVGQDAQIRYQIEGTPTFVMNGQVVNFPATNQTRLDVLRLRINSLQSGQ
jgi:protein-disulfide isomerase